jgi:hypothetical protein
VKLEAALAAVEREGGFDSSSSSTSQGTIRGWINEAVQDALAKSKYRKAVVRFGPTVAGQAQYAIPTNVVNVRTLRVGDSYGYMEIAGIEELWALKGGAASIWPGGFLATYADDAEGSTAEDTKPMIEVYPAPTEDGLVIEGVAAVTPAEITDDTAGTYELPLPADLVRPIAVDGAIGIGKLRVDERADLAAPFEKRRMDAVGELTKRANGLVGGRRAQLRIRRPRVT